MWGMTNSKIFDEVGCPSELKRAKKFIKKQADIILALEKEIEQKDNEILLIKERKKNETKTT
mgnify:FL=1